MNEVLRHMTRMTLNAVDQLNRMKEKKADYAWIIETRSTTRVLADIETITFYQHQLATLRDLFENSYGQKGTEWFLILTGIKTVENNLQVIEQLFYGNEPKF